MGKRSLLLRVAGWLKRIIIPQKEDMDFARNQSAKKSRRGKARTRNEGYDYMVEQTGLTKEELTEKLDRLRALEITTVPFSKFKAYGLYKMSDEEAKQALLKMKKEVETAYDLMWDLRLIDLGRLTYDEIEPKIREYKDIIINLMTDEYKKELASRASYLHPENMSPEEVDELAADLEFSRHILRFQWGNYAAFHFNGMPVSERREFLTPREREMLMPLMNSRDSIAILDDKLLTYEKLHDFFGREMVRISKSSDYKLFREFFERNPKTVVKPRFESKGFGVELIDASKVKDMRALFRQLLRRHKHFILEGFIYAADEIKALNPDSVNTVRVITYSNGEETSVWSSSIRIGHVGSFVDNASAGGVTAYVDPATGIICTDGIDEYGFIYVAHPDLGYTIKGCQLPAWDKALETVRKMSGVIEGAKFIGWDITCTSDYEWVLVEGNARTGFIGAQGPLGKGRRKEFLETIGADPKGVLTDERPLADAAIIEEEIGIPAEKTMQHLRHCEELGLDGRLYRPCRVWELSDEEVKALVKERTEA